MDSLAAVRNSENLRSVNAFCNADCLEEGRRQVDRKLVALEEEKNALIKKLAVLDTEKYALRRQRNAFATTSCLPAEVLSQIFTWNMLSHYRHTLQPSEHRRSLDWILVSHVCQYWREVAINSPQLWVYPPSHLYRWAAEMLLRSKTLPVIWEMDHLNYLQYPQFATDRIGEWLIRGSESSIGAFLRSLTKDTPPLNQMKRLVFSRLGDSLSSLDLSGLHAPCLQHLESQFYIKGLFAPQLTHLELWDIYDDRQVALSEVLDTLEGLPLLESFRFGEQYRPDPDFQLPTETPHRLVILPHLRFLQLKLGECQNSHLIGHITRLDISTSDLPVACDEPLSQRYVFASSTVTRVPTNTISTRLRTVWIRISNEGIQRKCHATHFYTLSVIRCNLELKGWSELLDVDLAQERSLPQIHLEADWLESEHSDFGSFLTSLCRLVGQQDDVEIVHVDLRGADLLESLANISPGVWDDALGRSPVKTLRVSCGGEEQTSYTSGLLHAVQGDGDKSQAGDTSFSVSNPFKETEKGIFPTLQKVVLDGVDFTGAMDFIEDSDADPQRQKFVDVLPDILSGHARMLVAMDLCVQHCLNVTEDQISQLKGAVGNVSWDGEKIEYDSSECCTASDGSSSDSEILSEIECVSQSDYSAAMLTDPDIIEGIRSFDSDGSSYASSESESS